MRLDTKILKRLDELLARADAILAARQHEFTGEDGTRYFKVSEPDVNAWTTSTLSILKLGFGETSTHYGRFLAQSGSFDGYEGSIKRLRAVLSAAKEDYEGGYLFNLRGLVKAEVLDDALEQAAALLKAGYKDPACVLIGVALESAIKELVTQSGLSVAKLDKMNVDLSKSGVYNLAKQKQITAWADLRNKAAHGEWSAYSEADVSLMHAGVLAFIADHL